MKKMVSTLVGVILVGGLSASAFAQYQQVGGGQQKTASPVYLEIDDDIHGDWSKQVRITSEKAQKLALGIQPGVIKEWKLDLAGNSLVYKAEIRSNWQEIDVYVDAVTGEAWSEHDPERMKQKVKISAEQAKKIALAQVNGSIKKIKLDEDEGQYIYEVEVRTDRGQEAELEISATSGDILDMEWDD